MTTDIDLTDDFAHYTPAFRAKNYLTGLTVTFSDGTRPELDSAMCGGTEFPAEFARLAMRWHECLHAASTINARYYDDWNRAGGALTVIAPATRETALSELRIVWNTLCRNYVTETLDADRRPWDCIFCGVPVPRDGRFDHRCPECMCVLNINAAGTDWE